MNKVIKNFSYTLLSNVIAFAISALVTFIVPKVLGVESYGYFQLYLFYFNYTGFLHFGWADGVYLRYGGQYYNELDKGKFSGQFRTYCLLELLFSIVIVWGIHVFEASYDKQIVLSMIALSIPLHLPKTFLQYVLQATNRIKEYSTITMLDKCTYIVLVLFLLVLGSEKYLGIIIADLIGKTCALIYAAYQCRDILKAKADKLESVIIEAKCNILAGIKLMIANIASMLVIGTIRAAIEDQWDIETFGKVSLTMSISNMLMVCIRAVSTIMFPMLRRTDSDKQSEIYETMRTCIMPLLLGMLVLYYPVKTIMSSWLPQYAESLEYMALLFPMCVFESKMSMLIETYMKTLRKEKALLVVNIITVGLSVLLAYLTAYRWRNLDAAVISILILIMFRCVLAECLLSLEIEINIRKDVILEIVLTVIFIWTSWYIKGLKGLLIYGISFLMYLITKYKDIHTVLVFVKGKIQK